MFASGVETFCARRYTDPVAPYPRRDHGTMINAPGEDLFAQGVAIPGGMRRLESAVTSRSQNTCQCVPTSPTACTKVRAADLRELILISAARNHLRRDHERAVQ